MGMDRWFLIAATLLAAIGGAWGMISVHRGQPQPLDGGLDERRRFSARSGFSPCAGKHGRPAR